MEQRSGAVPWNDLYIATTRAGQEYDGTLVGRAGPDFRLRAAAQAGGPRILIGDATDLPPAAASGDRVKLRALRFPPLAVLPGLSPADAAGPSKAGTSMFGAILNAAREPEPAPPAAASLIGRLRAFEDRKDAERKPVKAEETPGPEPDGTPRPGQGPKP